MKKTWMKMVIIILSFLIALYLLFPYEFMTIMNSHFGDNFSYSEQDKGSPNKGNLVNQAYQSIINNSYKKIPPTLSTIHSPPTIHMAELNPDTFVRLTKNFTYPLVVRGYLKNTPAVRKWSPEYFNKICGHLNLPVAMNNSTKSYGSNKNIEYLNVSDFLSKLQRKEKVYINNVSRIFGHYPELLDDLELEKLANTLNISNKNFNITHLFFGGSETATGLHTSFIGNFFYNVKGRKKWYLINPKYTRYLLPSISPTGLFAVSKIDIFSAKKHDPINCIPRYEVTLDEGDLLFNPPWWWHAISNKSDYTIGCANRITVIKAAFRNNPLYTSVFLSHPISNYKDYSTYGLTKSEANIKFDQGLLRDILLQDSKV